MQVINASAVANGANSVGSVVDLQGFNGVSLVLTANQIFGFLVEGSADGTNWGTLYGGNGATALSGASLPAGTRALVFETFGLPLIRVTMTNSSGGAAANLAAHVFRGNKTAR